MSNNELALNWLKSKKEQKEIPAMSTQLAHEKTQKHYRKYFAEKRKVENAQHELAKTRYEVEAALVDEAMETLGRKLGLDAEQAAAARFVVTSLVSQVKVL